MFQDAMTSIFLQEESRLFSRILSVREQILEQRIQQSALSIRPLRASALAIFRQT
jgi:hypothetical protein